jgi:hypothetical protein
MKTLLLLSGMLCLSLSATAQSAALKQNTQWLEKMMNMLVTDDDKDNKDNAKPEFRFTTSQMTMNVQEKSEKVAFGLHLSWLLKDIKKVSYKKDKDGYYVLMLDVPADRMKMNMGFGDDNAVAGSFNLKDGDKAKKNDDHTSFSLSTKDEKLVQEMVRKFEIVMAESHK